MEVSTSFSRSFQVAAKYSRRNLAFGFSCAPRALRGLHFARRARGGPRVRCDLRRVLDQDEFDVLTVVRALSG